MPGLVRAVGRTAVVAGTATAVSNRVSRRQANRWSDQEQQQYDQQQQQAPPPQQYQQPPPQYAPAPPLAPQPVMVVEAAPAEADMDAKLAQLQQLATLKSQGILSDAEFEEQKRKILNS
jgi:hypothetical protein